MEKALAGIALKIGVMEARYIVLSVVLLLAACGPSRQAIRDQQQRELIARYKAEDKATLAVCTSTYPPAERSATNAVPFAKCMLDAMSKVHYPGDDLVMAEVYKRLELAEKLTNGQLTLAEYQSQYAEYVAQANTQRQFRRNQAQVAQAAQRQANAAACMAARQRTANDQADANAQAAANQNNNSPAASLGAILSSATVISDEAQENRICNQ
jgi:hypothetical protein